MATKPQYDSGLEEYVKGLQRYSANYDDLKRWADVERGQRDKSEVLPKSFNRGNYTTLWDVLISNDPQKEPVREALTLCLPAMRPKQSLDEWKFFDSVWGVIHAKGDALDAVSKQYWKKEVVESLKQLWKDTKLVPPQYFEEKEDKRRIQVDVAQEEKINRAYAALKAGTNATDEALQPEKGPRKWVWITGAAVAGIFAIGSYCAYRGYQDGKEGAEQAAAAKPAPAATAPAEIIPTGEYGALGISLQNARVNANVGLRGNRGSTLIIVDEDGQLKNPYHKLENDTVVQLQIGSGIIPMRIDVVEDTMGSGGMIVSPYQPPENAQKLRNCLEDHLVGGTNSTDLSWTLDLPQKALRLKDAQGELLSIDPSSGKVLKIQKKDRMLSAEGIPYKLEVAVNNAEFRNSCTLPSPLSPEVSTYFTRATELPQKLDATLATYLREEAELLAKLGNGGLVPASTLRNTGVAFENFSAFVAAAQEGYNAEEREQL